jgi:hypothetical protein
MGNGFSASATGVQEGGSNAHLRLTQRATRAKKFAARRTVADRGPGIFATCSLLSTNAVDKYVKRL